MNKKQELSGQIWEECDCGREPVYMSAGYKCEVCAKKYDNLFDSDYTEVDKDIDDQY